MWVGAEPGNNQMCLCPTTSNNVVPHGLHGPCALIVVKPTRALQ